ncbi:MAG: class I SAM-dependent methyltransferase [Spirochaetia bacterium]|nr:class I SAM-dependent methyltransferase [Spirochaetia bacterium]
MKAIQCPLCGSGSDKHTLLYKYDLYGFKKCSTCSLVMQNPQPVFSDITERYDEDYFKYEIENEEPFFALMMMALSDIDFDSLDFSSSSEKSILDIGCATGRFLFEFKNRGWKTAGVEICESAAQYGNKHRGVNIQNCPLEDAQFPDKSFSVVHASHLIEHLNDPGSFLKEIYRILDEKGYLIIVTPNIDSLQGVLFRSKWRSAIADHLFLYSLKTLENMCCKYGFTRIRKKTWGGLARGLAPAGIKKIFDKAAKKTGTGDVMVMLLQKKG